ncbi:Nucleoprotein TPR, putative isoform 1 [Theobroma cacao]|uniref:Nucleoprotein TPR, putative isoform 1 n=1 Tax=Theobroma cacao TaxID=3641 RepID=A0A061FAB9_THECC|nr:Nucleoprotein TPR, putative isoform 1 [Theobroma cacao]
MPLFISEEELSQLSNDVATVAERADAYIREIYGELETAKAKADTAAITAEQTCSLLEQKFLSISGELSDLQSQNAQLQSCLDERLADLAQSQAQKHQLHLQSIGKDGEIERLTIEVSELHKSRRQLLEMIEQKDSEIADKNAVIKTYLDKIVNLTDNAAHKEARISETEAELVRAQATCTRLSQGKELIERHNVWLNEELTAKVDDLVKFRRTQSELEADMSAKLADVERQYNESSSSLNWHKERMRELEIKLTSLQEDLCSSKEVATSNEERFSAELSTANKLVELYKESSEEWSKKAGELEGVIKALEMRLIQVENNYKDRLEKEVSARKQFEKETADLKEKLEKCESEIEAARKANELNLLPLGNFTTATWIDSFDANDMVEDNRALVPKIPVGVSGTALAASLLRDGWSLAKMYAKYQEAVDALRHERLGRKESESTLQRVLCELEEKAVFIMDERAEYEKMREAYSMINQKLQNSTSERSQLEKMIQELKADLRRHERENSLAQKEIADLQKQVTVLLKECRDIQLRCGPVEHDFSGDCTIVAAADRSVEPDADRVISELTFKDINGLVERNVQLRSLVRDLSDQIESKEMEFKEKLEMELKKQTDEAASKVAVVLQRAEEQGHMIESLHASVAMYKKLYEEEHKLHLSYSPAIEAAPDAGKKDFLLLLEGSQEASKKAQEKVAQRVRCLEEDQSKARGEIISLRSERDKLALEANFAREKLESVMKEAEHQRDEINGVLARNVEFSQLIVDYQRKLRESSESLNAAEEHSRKLIMEVSVLKHEKEMLANAEKRACDEVCSLSARVHRLQASLDTIQSAEEVREEARALDRRRQEEYVIQIEKEWAEAKKQLQEERDNVRTLTSGREQTLKDAMKQVEEIGKELANALHACAAAEARAAISEARLSDLEKKLKSSDVKILEIDGGTVPSSVSRNEVVELPMTSEEIETLKEEAKANRDHMLQYKNIAQINEAALKQMELTHESFKNEAEKLKRSLEAELGSLRERVSELENESSLKSEEVAFATAGKLEALSSASAEITSLKEETAVKSSQIVALEIQISSMKENLEKEHEKWRAAQANYERQVILQSETIQELTRTSQALALLQGEASELRKSADAHKSENAELKAKWEVEKSILEESRNKAEKKYDELNEQNKLLHSRIEALHIQLAEKDRGSSVILSRSAVQDPLGDSGLQNVVNYLRRTKEIAETEISLLKQEKLRLQSQIENALKAAETAQATLNAERANIRAALMTEEEIKSLQHQVREMNLLRESNMQLREENKHNFEECQNLREAAQKNRIESETLESQLMKRQIELEASKKEIEIYRTERDCLEKRVSELLERFKNIDVEDYDRLKNDAQHKEEILKEKDAQIDEIMNLLSKKQDTISKLECDLATSKLELNEKDKKLNDILLLEANLKSDMEKQRKLVLQYKRRAESLTKEKEQISKENQALSKLLEELKQGRRSISDTTGDQVMKEKEEKDTRIQSLEKTVERTREELKKEKDEHQNEKAKRIKCERTIMEAVRKTEKGKATVLSELEKYQQALKRLSEELDKLKHAEGNLPEGTSVVQLLSGTISDDHASPYLSAAEDFERVALSILNELGTGSGDVPLVDPSVSTSSGTVPHHDPIIASSTAPATSHHQPAKALEERRSILPKTNIETRKTGRKLVRPRFVKAEEPQGYVEMSEATSLDGDAQGTLAQQNQPVRKRLASAASELCEDLPVPGETSTDVAVPVLKKPRGSDSPPEAAEGQAAALSENLGCTEVTEEAYDTVGDVAQGSNEEVVDVEKEEAETMEEKSDEPKQPQLDGKNEVELLENKNNMLDEMLDRPSGTEMAVDDESKNLAEQDSQQLLLETESEREEGELVPEVVAEIEGGADVHNGMGCSEIGDCQQELVPLASPSRVDDEALFTAAVEGDNSPDVNDEKNNEGDVAEEIVAEGFDKLNDGNHQTAVETDQMPEAATGTAEPTSVSVQPDAEVTKPASTSVTPETEVSKPASTSVPPDTEVSKHIGSSSAPEAEDVKQTSPVGATSTLVNLQERARERAMLRQAGVLPSSSRGRGRPAMRGRVARGRSGRGRGQNSEKQ